MPVQDPESDQNRRFRGHADIMDEVVGYRLAPAFAPLAIRILVENPGNSGPGDRLRSIENELTMARNRWTTTSASNASGGNVAKALPRSALIRARQEAHVATWTPTFCFSLTACASTSDKRCGGDDGSDVGSDRSELVGYQMPNSTCREFPVVKRR